MAQPAAVTAAKHIAAKHTAMEHTTTAHHATAHTPHKPSWDCLACGRPWPCDPAREALSAVLDLVALAGLMWDALEEAVRDLPPTPAAELFDRFLTWTVPPNAAGPHP